MNFNGTIIAKQPNVVINISVPIKLQPNAKLGFGGERTFVDNLSNIGNFNFPRSLKISSYENHCRRKSDQTINRRSRDNSNKTTTEVPAFN